MARHNMLWNLQVSGRTPGGAATFVGCRDRTPGLILTTPESNIKDSQSMRTWLSASPFLSSNTQNQALLQTATGKQSHQIAGVLQMQFVAIDNLGVHRHANQHASNAIPSQLCGHYSWQISGLITAYLLLMIQAFCHVTSHVHIGLRATLP